MSDPPASYGRDRFIINNNSSNNNVRSSNSVKTRVKGPNHNGGPNLKDQRNVQQLQTQVKALARVSRDGGPDFKAQTSSILKTDSAVAYPVKETEASVQATEEARRQQEIDQKKRNVVANSQQQQNSFRISETSAATTKHNNYEYPRTDSGRKVHKNTTTATTTNGSSPPPPPPPTTTKQDVRAAPQSEIEWEFDGPDANAKSCCCTIL